METQTAVVRFEPWGRSFAVLRGGSLLRAALRAHLPIASSCRGNGVCLACRVRIVDGGENLTTVSPREIAAGLHHDERLACMASVHGPVTITTSYW